MITLEINDKEFKISSSYKELNLQQYIDIIKLSEVKTESIGVEADISVISALSDNPKDLEEVLWEMNATEFSELKEYFSWVNDSSILDEFKSQTPLEKLTIDGVDYGILSNYNKMAMREITSFETLLAQEQSDLHRLELAFGVLIRPIDNNGNLVKFSEKVFFDLMKIKSKVIMSDVYAVISFFLPGDKISTTKNTSRYSIRTQ